MEERIVWANGKVELVKFVLVCMYTPMYVRIERGRKEARKSWDELNECLGGLSAVGG